MNVKIKENSFIAWIASKILGSHNVAIVLGSTICLHNCSKTHFLSDKKWLMHELRHVEQWHENYYWLFPFKYLWFSMRYGYKNNPFEKDAINNENNYALLNKFNIV